MNPWLIACLALLPALFAAAYVTFRGDTGSRLAGMEFGGILAVLILAFLAEGINRPDFIDVALALALLEFGGGMVFARFIEGKL